MRSPSVKRLVETFKIAPSGAKLVKKLARATDNPGALADSVEKHCPATYEDARSCPGDPYRDHMWRVNVVLHAVDVILGTHGVECLRRKHGRPLEAPPYEYCNAGDPYTATLIYSRATDNIYIGCWATLVENHPYTCE